jgi:hypothetical protein
MDTSLWAIRREDIIKVETQENKKTRKDFAVVEYRHNGQVKFAVVKDLVSKPSDMDLKDWCITVLNTHYIIMMEEKKRGKKLNRIIVPG